MSISKHLSVAFRVDVDDVVAAVVVAAVYQHCVQDVQRRVAGVRLLQEFVQV